MSQVGGSVGPLLLQRWLDCNIGAVHLVTVDLAARRVSRKRNRGERAGLTLFKGPYQGCDYFQR